MRFSARELTRTCGAALLAAFCAAALPNAARAGFDYDENGNAFVTGQAVIAFKPGTTLITMKSILARNGVDPSKLQFIDSRTVAIKFDPKKDVLSFCDQLRASGWITASSPNHLYYCVGIPNDPYYSLQWGLKPDGGSTASRGADFQGASAYVSPTVGSGVRVGVIDSGVDMRHPDIGFLNSVPPGPLVPATPGLYPAITFVQPLPWNGSPVKNPPYNFPPGSPDDDFGHGTHVIGIIAAVTGNRSGVASASPSASILPIKIFDRNGAGATDAILANAIQFAATNNCRVINMSLGGGTAGFVVTNAIHFAQTQTVGGIKGVVCVAAMGNTSTRAIRYPAAIAGTVAVGATGPAGSPATYSTTGPHITLAAPGGDGGVIANNAGQIFSTYPSYSVGLGPPIIPKPTYTNYSYMSGTSMATPYVAAAAAMLLQKKPYLSQAQVWAQLALFSTHVSPLTTVTTQSGTSTPVPDTAWDESRGYGLLNATSLLTAKQPSQGSTTGIPHVFPYKPRNHFTYTPGPLPITPVANGMQAVDSVARNTLTNFSVVVVDDKGERIPGADVRARFTILSWPVPPTVPFPRYPASNISETILYDDGAAAHGDLLNQDCVYGNKVFIPSDYVGCTFQVQYIVTAPGMRANTNRVVNIQVQ
jgi:subtilisin family serine protease